MAFANERLGLRLLETGEHREALVAYLKAEESRKKQRRGVPTWIMNRLAWLMANSPDLQPNDRVRSVELAEKAVQRSPENADFQNTLGVARYRSAQYSAAIEALQESIKLGSGGNSFDFFFLAMANWKLGDEDRARTRYDQAIEWMQERGPGNGELIRFRSEAEKLLGTPAEAPVPVQEKAEDI